MITPYGQHYRFEVEGQAGTFPWLIEQFHADNTEDYGITYWTGIHVDIGVYLDCDSMTWKCKLTSATPDIHTWSRLLSGVSPVSAASATEGNYCEMLEGIANFGVGASFYSLEAVEAHEQVHIDVITEHVQAVFADLKSSIEGLSVLATCSMSASNAKDEIKEMSAYTTAIVDAQTTALGAILVDTRHIPDDVTSNYTLASAEMSVTSAISIAIQALAVANNWAPCP